MELEFSTVVTLKFQPAGNEGFWVVSPQEMCQKRVSYVFNRNQDRSGDKRTWLIQCQKV